MSAIETVEMNIEPVAATAPADPAPASPATNAKPKAKRARKSSKAKTAKRETGYGLFAREKYSGFKAEVGDVPAAEGETVVARNKAVFKLVSAKLASGWNGLDAQQRDEYKQKADSSNKSRGIVPKKAKESTGRVNGFAVLIKSNYKEEKAAAPDARASDILKTLALKWKSESAEFRAGFEQKAAEINAQRAAIAAK